MSVLSVPDNDLQSQVLAKFKPEDLLNVISGLKKVVEQNPQQAREMLEANQDLAFAVLQAELLMGLVSEQVVSEQIELYKAKASAAAPVDPQQEALIQQVLSLTEEQIALLPPDQQEQVRSMRQQYTK